jgi:hypothetical protein
VRGSVLRQHPPALGPHTPPRTHSRSGVLAPFPAARGVAHPSKHAHAPAALTRARTRSHAPQRSSPSRRWPSWPAPSPSMTPREPPSAATLSAPTSAVRCARQPRRPRRVRVVVPRGAAGLLPFVARAPLRASPPPCCARPLPCPRAPLPRRAGADGPTQPRRRRALPPPNPPVRARRPPTRPLTTPHLPHPPGGPRRQRARPRRARPPRPRVFHPQAAPRAPRPVGGPGAGRDEPRRHHQRGRARDRRREGAGVCQLAGAVGEPFGRARGWGPRSVGGAPGRWRSAPCSSHHRAVRAAPIYPTSPPQPPRTWSS